MTDEITRETLVARDGQVVHPRVRGAGVGRLGGKMIVPANRMEEINLWIRES